MNIRFSNLGWLLVLALLLLGPFEAQAGRTLVDAAGRRVVLPLNIERVLTTFKPATLSVLCLGLQDLLVGVDNSSRGDALTLAVAPEVADLPGVGSKSRGINLETVMGLNPDLVILYSQKQGQHLADRLQEAGFPALVIKPETFPSIHSTLRILASAAGRPEQAEAVIQAMDRVQKLTSERVRSIPLGQRKKVYYAGPRGLLSTAPSGMLQDVMIQAAGGINVAGELHGYFKPVSVEQLILWAPESLVLCRMIRSQAEAMLKRPEFSALPALQTQNIHVFPSSLAPWDFPSPLSALGVLWLGIRLYPDRFADLSLREQVNDFHRTLFERSLSRMGGTLDDGLAPFCTWNESQGTAPENLQKALPHD